MPSNVYFLVLAGNGNVRHASDNLAIANVVLERLIGEGENLLIQLL
jgi:hypothetical protein